MGDSAGREIDFPDPRNSNEDGLLAIGGDLKPDTLFAAYRKGIFPWFSEDQAILWWSPDPRCVLFPHRFHCSRRLSRRLRQDAFEISWNQDFTSIIRLCAETPRKGETGTWILPAMVEAYQRLHTLGFAHSVEVYRQGELIGGLYGVLLNQVFFAESMFSLQRDGSKMALAYLAGRATDEDWKLIDCQFLTDHLASLGAEEISRERFLNLIGFGSDGNGWY